MTDASVRPSAATSRKPIPSSDGHLAIAVGVYFFTAQLSMTSAPYFIGSYVREHGLSATAGGTLFLVEMFAFGITMLASSPLLARVSVRHLIAGGICLMILGQCGSVMVGGWSGLIGCRIVTGIAAGLVNVGAVAAAARALDPSRIYGWANALTTALCAGLYVAAAAASSRGGSTGVFVVLAALATLSMAFVSSIPGDSPGIASGQLPVGSLRAGMAALIALIIFNAGVNALWPFLEQLADAIGIDVRTFGAYQAIASLVAAGGGLAAGRLGTRYGRLRPLAFGLLALGLASFMLANSSSGIWFLAAETAFLSTWYFVFSYVLDVAAVVDPSGRTVGLTAAGLPLSLGFGSIAGGSLIDLFSIQAVGFFGFAATIVALVIIAPTARRVDKTYP